MVGFERIIIAGPKLGVFSLLLRNFDSLCPRNHVLDGGPDPHGFMSMTLSHWPSTSVYNTVGLINRNVVKQILHHGGQEMTVTNM